MTINELIALGQPSPAEMESLRRNEITVRKQAKIKQLRKALHDANKANASKRRALKRLRKRFEIANRYALRADNARAYVSDARAQLPPWKDLPEGHPRKRI